ncbi:MAG: hypothetical protein SOU84_03505 [Candidatus Faecimonas sp.]|nr:hypothetical protein [Mycoplasmatota bacterium]MDY2908209.1 hypothetical protein [Candidatus Faecimonas sp.]
MNSKIIYSFQTSKKILCAEINNILDNNTIDNKEELFRKIGDTLNWVYVCLEKVKIDNNSEYSSYVSAFKGASNIHKHSKKEVDFDNFINCSLLPCTLPAILSDRGIFCWREMNEKIIDSEDQVKNYNKYLANKDVIDSLNKIEKIIIELNSNLQ